MPSTLILEMLLQRHLYLTEFLLLDNSDRGSSKVEEAVESYQRAANLYKMAKNWNNAGNAFCQAANLNIKMGGKHDAATNYIDAANCFKKSDTAESVTCFLKAIEIYTDMGRFTMAAKHHQSIAEIYENEAVDLERAVQNYEQAADYFRGEESNSSANKCLLKVAQYTAQLENYEKAIQIYEQVAMGSLESSLLKYSAKEYFLRASLCHLCVDVLNAQHALERYKEQCPAFQDSREYKFIKTLIENLEEQNLEGYTEAVKEYDSISRLDQWYTTMLLRIKKQINENPDLR
ncbi:alpha-soluble NSF attachment protein isoform X2 [Trichogramma pretiosum]|uniref:alpha-soluble NSF attachment protein isoform X2 n=1 Tax=Trichogramma pretiosum TaxID=7493 RepID=UPI0006C940A6|nr:alpha-soluble NSF attachment protein isoform X2 [Trichogramma pretiosum]